MNSWQLWELFLKTGRQTMKKSSYKQLGLKNWEKFINFFNITKAYKSKEKFFSANRVSRCAQNYGQVMIG